MNKHEEKLLDAMVDLWVKADAPEWVKQQVKEELRKQRSRQAWDENISEWRKTDFHVWDVVQTKNGHDRGLVTLVDKNNMPTQVMSAPGLNIHTGEYTEISYYGGVNSVVWYKTGERMTLSEWYELYSKKKDGKDTTKTEETRLS